MIRLFQSYTVALDGVYHLVDSLILCDDVRLQLLSHTLQANTFLLSHTLYGYSGHHAYYLSHLFIGDGLTHIYLAFLPFAIQLL